MGDVGGVPPEVSDPVDAGDREGEGVGAAGGEGDGAVWDVGVFERASVEAGCGECEGGGQRGALVSEWGGGYEVELLSGGSGDGISGAGAGGGLGVGGVGWGFSEGGKRVGTSLV